MKPTDTCNYPELTKDTQATRVNLINPSHLQFFANTVASANIAT